MDLETAAYVAKLYTYNGEVVVTNDPNVVGEIIRISGTRLFWRIRDRSKGPEWEDETIASDWARTGEVAKAMLVVALRERGYV